MADTHEVREIHEGSSATTVLVTIVILLIIGAFFYFGFARGNWGGNGGTNIDINATVPEGTPGGGIAE